MARRPRGRDGDATTRPLNLEKGTTMPSAAAGLATRLRTWLLVAGLTALLISVGAAIGGAFLYLFVGFAVLMNVVG
jgi:hypothetical protein